MSQSYLRMLGTRFEWKRRREAYLSHLQSEYDKARTEAASKIAAQSGIDYAMNWTEWHLQKLMRATVITEILKPSRFSVSDAPRFAEAALILAQYVREQMTFLQLGVDRDLPIPSKPLEEMDSAELDMYIAACRAAKDAIIRGTP